MSECGVVLCSAGTKCRVETGHGCVSGPASCPGETRNRRSRYFILSAPGPREDVRVTPALCGCAASCACEVRTDRADKGDVRSLGLRNPGPVTGRVSGPSGLVTGTWRTVKTH